MRIAVAGRGGMGNWVLASSMLRAFEIMGHEIELLFDYDDPRTALLEQISWLPVLDYKDFDAGGLESRYGVVFGFKHPGDLSGVLQWTLSETRNAVLIPLVNWLAEPRHEVEYFMRAARLLGWVGPPPPLFVPQRPIEHPAAHIGFAIGAVDSRDWYKKMWPWQYWQDLLIALAGREEIVIYGGPSDMATAKKITLGIPQQPARFVLGLDLREVAARLAQQCKVLVCNDTGIMHLATAVGCPVVALFGPTSLKKNSPVGQLSKTHVLASPAACRPCYGMPIWDQCIGGCMAQISVGSVFNQILPFLA